MGVKRREPTVEHFIHKSNAAIWAKVLSILPSTFALTPPTSKGARTDLVEGLLIDVVALVMEPKVTAIALNHRLLFSVGSVPMTKTNGAVSA